jgi:hypothetical protein
MSNSQKQDPSMIDSVSPRGVHFNSRAYVQTSRPKQTMEKKKVRTYTLATVAVSMAAGVILGYTWRMAQDSYRADLCAQYKMYCDGGNAQ